jgi:hypothetical protein
LGVKDKDRRISELGGNIKGNETEVKDNNETVYITLSSRGDLTLGKTDNK